MAKFGKDDSVINEGDKDNPAREHGTIVAPLPTVEGHEQCYLVQWPCLPSPIEELEGDLLRWETRTRTAPQSR